MATNYMDTSKVNEVIKYLNRAEMNQNGIDSFVFGYLNQRLIDLNYAEPSEEQSEELIEFMFKLQSTIGYDLGY